MDRLTFFKVQPYLGGLGNGAIEELKSIPTLVIMGLSMLDPDEFSKMMTALSQLDPIEVGKQMFQEKLKNFLARLMLPCMREDS